MRPRVLTPRAFAMRFKTPQRSIGNVSQKVLATNLRGMEDAGLVVRRVYVEVPPRVEYSLTELGQSLRPIMDAMWDWGETYQTKAQQPPYIPSTLLRVLTIPL